MKKSFFVLNLMATTMLGANAWADTCTAKSGDCGSNCSYTLDANCLLTVNPINAENPVIIGYGAFEETPATSVAFNGNITTISAQAFKNASSLTSVTIPDSVTSLGYDAFSYASSLTSVTIGNGPISIGHRAFDHATSLTSVTIPNSVTSIGQYAFGSDSNLTSVIIEGTPTIDSDAFGYLSENTVVYCLSGHSACNNKGHAITYYDKDENGVYSLTKDGQTYYYSSADKMMAGGVENGCTSPAACAAVIAAATAQQGTGAGSATGTGSSTGSGKRIYTVEEARQAVEAAGTDTVNFRIRYK